MVVAFMYGGAKGFEHQSCLLINGKFYDCLQRRLDFGYRKPNRSDTVLDAIPIK